jgi:type IV fimbrial biogenesis protein FimT
MLTSRHQRGVSFIEVVVAMALLFILVATVMPDMSSWLRSLKVRNAAESVRNGIERARVEALRSNQNVSFWMVSDAAKTLSDACALSSSSASWVVSLASPAGKCSRAISTTTDPMIVEKFSSADGASAVTVAANAGAQSVTFNGFGQVVQTGTPITTVDFSLTDGGARALRVMVAAGGAVRMCDPAVAATDARAC